MSANIRRGLFFGLSTRITSYNVCYTKLLRELVNELGKNLNACSNDLKAYVLERFAVMLAPIAPHLAEECWAMIGGKDSLFEKPRWFDADEKALVESSVNIAVQVSGKMRATIEFPMDSDEAAVIV